MDHIPPDTDTLLSLRGLGLSYRALPALRAIDFTLRAGEHWACLGPNGAGKTSLARVISGQATHFTGAMQRAPALTRRGIAYVCFEQARALCARDHKLDDAEFRADARDPGTTVEALLQRARPAPGQRRHWARRLGIDHLSARGVRYLSTGELRRTLLAAALLAQPALLILDNPLDGLDRDAQEALRRILDELTGSDTALLMLCRQPDDIPPGVTHVLVLDGGGSVTSGPRREVLDDARVTALLAPPLPPPGPLPQAAQRPYPAPPAGPLLALRNVSVHYGGQQVLRQVDWVFERGMHCCVAGPNGCGKTTLLSLINGDNHLAYGQDITLFGRRRGCGESVWDIRQKFGQVDTRLHLDFARGMSVLEVVVSGFFDTVGLYDDWGDNQRSRAQQWLAALGLSGLGPAAFDGLSFGLQRMVLLARAMVKAPLILLLDEPTLGLDGYHRRLVLRAIDHIAADSDTQIIFVSHTVGELPRCINQLLRFEPRGDGFEVVATRHPATTQGV